LGVAASGAWTYACGVPSEFKPVPPDHPMFSGQVSFVFQHELPEDEPEQDEHEPEDDQ
jgi:hypothetical protein